MDHADRTEHVRLARQLIILQYAQRLPLRSSKFLWPNRNLLFEAQAYLDDDLFGNRALPGASKAYEKSFLKILLEKLQTAVNEAQSQGRVSAEDSEVDESLLERYALLMATDFNRSVHSHGAPESSHTCYLFSSSLKIAQNTSATEQEGGRGVLSGFQPIILREEGSFISEGTTGLQTWEASLRLGSHLLANRQCIFSQDTRVLELGAGAGFLATLCSHLLPTHGEGRVLATDCASNVLARLNETRHSNGIPESRMQVRPLNWLDLLHPDESHGNNESAKLLQDFCPTIILAADVVFDPTLFPALAAAICAAIVAGSAERDNCRLPTVLISSTVRNAETYEAFLKALQNANLKPTPIPLNTAPTLVFPARLLEGFAPHNMPQHADMVHYGCFPSAHDTQRDGRVELLQITLCNS
ncbi:hypothetical protein K437DRAFT_283303 [Tilletiaria anomala UBC 951]|uniref:S-adenosyl-L-methionine-dependent methyltransferase n=1 Tax=Tilletiaria anomala (strain ATCC 24038 / CBS 436.72 / UBC 951) TaxID=1037660 RepID=A0A066WHE7_TILAU|nr:uncharacterized protein K437DRAFT_283303 [Tilletiaria anomala UBC 951]KDN53402.1 hypothetical protein K437DRAFT_283303 [Tilletiaria anomala UBC 951]